MDLLNNIVSQINDIFWSYILIILLIAAGIIFSIRTRFVQIRMLREMIHLLTEGVGTKTEGQQISSFQAFCVSTASRVGVGNIAGIAIAVVLGGPGAIFWMWVIALLGASSGFIESTLAQIYKIPRSDDKGYLGGPAFYIKNALHSPKAAIFFAIIISITYGLIFNSVQSAIVIFGGLKRIAHVSEYLVPFMAGLYLLVALFITIYNITELPHILTVIFENAWGINSVAGGTFGAAIMTGIKRGLFSNEAGMGSVPNAAATAEVSHPVKQGLIQSFGVFVDTFLICSASAFIVLLSTDYQSTGLTGIQLVQYDLSLYFGDIAVSAVAILILNRRKLLLW